MPERYAVYYAPSVDSPLGVFGRSWLGRCAETGDAVMQPPLSGVGADELHMLTRTPRQYGFHATLVPPFELGERGGFSELADEVRRVSRNLEPFYLDGLSVRAIGSFLALVPADQGQVSRLAEACLRGLFMMRKPPSLAELERRRARGLTPRQEHLLVRWGYPYVLDEFKFHMTLTDSIVEKGRRMKMLKLVARKAESLCRTKHPVNDICLFHQRSANDPFLQAGRFPLGEGAEQA